MRGREAIVKSHKRIETNRKEKKYYKRDTRINDSTLERNNQQATTTKCEAAAAVEVQKEDES